jgi:hypothetical protein
MKPAPQQKKLLRCAVYAERDSAILIVLSPDRHRAAREDFFDKAVGQELADDFLSGSALQVAGSSSVPSSRCNAVDKTVRCGGRNSFFRLREYRVPVIRISFRHRFLALTPAIA